MDDGKRDELQEKLESLRAEIVNLRVELTRLAAVMAGLPGRLQRVERELWGNGGIGLSAKVTALLYIVTLVAVATVGQWAQSLLSLP